MMPKTDDHIRSFAMSGFLITDELKTVEKKFGVDLGHGYAASSEAEDYYPQFEKIVRAEAATMSRHYEVFYCLEKAIRKLISEAFSDVAGAEWWSSGKIPSNIVKEVEGRIQREIDSGITRRSDALIDYTTFGELSIIINSNWEIFETIFSSRRAVEKVMSSLNLLRGPIAHCCPISDDEEDRLRLTVKDWFRIIG